MGIGLFFDGLAYGLKKGSKPVLDQIAARNKSVKDQTIKAGIAQLREGDIQFRADKNAPVAEPHQGAHTSEVPLKMLENSSHVHVMNGELKKALQVL